MSDPQQEPAFPPGESEQEVPHRPYGAQPDSGSRRLRSPGLYHHHDPHRSQSPEKELPEEPRIPKPVDSSKPFAQRRMTASDVLSPPRATREHWLRRHASNLELSLMHRSPARGRSLNRDQIPSTSHENPPKEEPAPSSTTKEEAKPARTLEGPTEHRPEQPNPTSDNPQPEQPNLASNKPSPEPSKLDPDKPPPEPEPALEKPHTDPEPSNPRSANHYEEKPRKPWVRKSRSHGFTYFTSPRDSDEHSPSPPTEEHNSPSVKPRLRRSSSVITLHNFEHEASRKSPENILRHLGIKPFDSARGNSQQKSRPDAKRSSPCLWKNSIERSAFGVSDLPPLSLDNNSPPPPNQTSSPLTRKLSSPRPTQLVKPPTPILKPQSSHREFPVAERKPSSIDKPLPAQEAHTHWPSGTQWTNFSEASSGGSIVQTPLAVDPTRRVRVQDRLQRIHETRAAPSSGSPTPTVTPATTRSVTPATAAAEGYEGKDKENKKGRKRRRVKGKWRRYKDRVACGFVGLKVLWMGKKAGRTYERDIPG